MKKYLLLGFAVILANSFTAVKAADYCSSVALTNARGSPPVVLGNVVTFVATGLSPVLSIYLDGNLVFQAFDTVDPPNTFFPVSGQLTVPYGNHTMSTNWEACTLNFSNVPPPPQITDTPTMTMGYLSVPGGSGFYTGFQGTNFGSMSPTVTYDFKTYRSFLDVYACNPYAGCYLANSSISISGFTSNPGSGWLISASAQGRTKTGSSASYSYNSSTGTASWTWWSQSFGFGSSGTTACTIVHH